MDIKLDEKEVIIILDALVEALAFDNNADYCYANLKQGDFVLIEGSINSNIEINIKEIIKIYWNSNIKNKHVYWQKAVN